MNYILRCATLIVLSLSFFSHAQFLSGVDSFPVNTNQMERLELQGRVKTAQVSGYENLETRYYFTPSGQLDRVEREIPSFVSDAIAVQYLVYAYDSKGNVTRQTDYMDDTTPFSLDSAQQTNLRRYSYRNDRLAGYWENASDRVPFYVAASYDGNRLVALGPSRFLPDDFPAPRTVFYYNDGYIAEMHSQSGDMTTAISFDASQRVLSVDYSIEEVMSHQQRFDYQEGRLVRVTSQEFDDGFASETITLEFVDETLDDAGNWIERQWRRQETDEVKIFTREISYYE